MDCRLYALVHFVWLVARGRTTFLAAFSRVLDTGVAAKENGALARAVIGNVFGTGGAFLGGKIGEIDRDLIFQPEGA